MTFSLSQSSASFLRQFSAEENSHLSTVLDSLIEASRRARELAQLNARISAFYDSLPDSAVQEDVAWAQMGEQGLAAVFEEIDQATPELTSARR
jgi:hypothetical protein